MTAIRIPLARSRGPLVFSLCLSLAARIASGDIVAITPVVNVDASAKPWWMSRHRACVDRAKRGGAPVVFIGDSITHNWESIGSEQWNRYFGEGPRRALNLGFSCDRTENMLWRLDNGELDGFEAKAVILLVGTNNIGHPHLKTEPLCETVLGVKAVLDRIRKKQPQAKIVLCAILPRGREAKDPKRLRNAAVNHEIRRFADGKTVFWCDFTDRLVTADGFLPAEVMPDGLHPGDYGYEVWASAILPYVDAAVEGRTMPPSSYAAAIGPSFDREGPSPAAAVSRIGRRERGWQNPEAWLDEVRRHRVAAADLNGECDLVFLGDQVARGWEESGASVLAEMRKRKSVLVLGSDGDRVQNVLWRARRGELDGFRTKLVVLSVGAGNIRDRPEAIACGVKTLLAEVGDRQPQARIALLPILPSGREQSEPQRLRITTVNRMLRNLTDGKGVVWLDFTDRVFRPDGSVSRNVMSETGQLREAFYRILAEVVAPCL